MSENKKVYTYNVIWAEMNGKLMDMASPSTVDFFVHKKFIQAGHAECMWVDECEYIFPTGTDMAEVSALYVPGSDYKVFEDSLRGIGFDIEDVTTDCSILV